MRTLVLMMVVLVGCAVDAPVPDPVVMEDDLTDREAPAMMDPGKTDGPDVCALAADLPEDDICRHVCDPDALAAQMLADGNERGACYSLYCQLSETVHVVAGVCLL